VHRVGYAPDSWAWTPWQYATDGRFSGRWDDPDGLWRSLYVGGSRLACYVEVLAVFRPDPVLSAEFASINETPEDAAEHPTLGFGQLPRAWLEPRRLGTATLHGWYAVPGGSQSLPTLRVRFLALARSLGLPDLDGAAIRLAEPRRLTQHLAGWLYEQTGPDGTPLTGVQFASRYGDELVLWAVFERAGDTPSSAQLHDSTSGPLDPRDPELTQALQLHRLTWTG